MKYAVGIQVIQRQLVVEEPSQISQEGERETHWIRITLGDVTSWQSQEETAA